MTLIGDRVYASEPIRSKLTTVAAGSIGTVVKSENDPQLGQLDTVKWDDLKYGFTRQQADQLIKLPHSAPVTVESATEAMKLAEQRIHTLLGRNNNSDKVDRCLRDALAHAEEGIYQLDEIRFS